MIDRVRIRHELKWRHKQVIAARIEDLTGVNRYVLPMYLFSPYAAFHGDQLIG